MQKRKRAEQIQKIDSELKSAKAEILRKGSYGVYELLNKNQTPKTKTRAEQLDAAVCTTVSRKTKQKHRSHSTASV